MNLDLVGAVGKFPRQLVGDPAKLLLEYVTTHFLIHRHATRSLCLARCSRLDLIVALLTCCVEGRCPKFT